MGMLWVVELVLVVVVCWGDFGICFGILGLWVEVVLCFLYSWLSWVFQMILKEEFWLGYVKVEFLGFYFSDRVLVVVM